MCDDSSLTAAKDELPRATWNELHEEPLQRVRLLVAYDGGAFRGFAKNRNVRSVAGDLEAALSRILRHPVTVTGAGRTDAGVHAWGQVVSFDTFAERLEPLRLRKSLNGMCAPDLVVREVAACERGFDARFSAVSRTYRYDVHGGPIPNPFTHRVAWHLVDDLDLAAMNDAASRLVGRHDFSSFCRRPPADDRGQTVSLVRTVSAATWSDLGDDRLRFEITAKAFCHQMVRSIVGTLVDVGRGHRSVDEVPGIIEARDRSVAGNLAPPQGLCLWEVGY